MQKESVNLASIFQPRNYHLGCLLFNLFSVLRHFQRFSFYFLNAGPVCGSLKRMTPEMMKVQVRGFTIVGLMLAAAGVILAVFLVDMADNALMGASPKYRPSVPAVAPTDITRAPQCAPGYDKPWVGCQSLAQ